jgi:formylglycine-generating enzyme required for sulfatase activity
MKKLLLAIFTIAFAQTILANNITVANTSLSSQNTTAHTQFVNFDVSWDNSWRTSTNESNYDGAWVFAKFRKINTNQWLHCTLSTTGAFIGGVGGIIQVQNDNKGAFVYRAADGISNVSYTGNHVVWNYGADGILDNETVEVKVFALEMVYIPTGSFYAGSGGTETWSIYQVPASGTTTPPYLITNSAITIGAAAGNLNAVGGMAAGTIATTFPTGYNAFWIMKYECSQQQYADFLNNLDNVRAAFNFNGILTGSSPNYIAPNPERAMGNMGLGMAADLADWSCLRPYSELEFEKVCRGYNTPALPNEYVWSSTNIVALSTVSNVGLANETVATPTNANAHYSGGTPIRVGLFARATGATRENTGAAYYGVMNMGDNQLEQVIHAGNTTGRAVLASVHGDGNLSNTGLTDIATWIPTAAWGLKGGTWNTGFGAIYCRTSERGVINAVTTYSAGSYTGIRLARTAQ